MHVIFDNLSNSEDKSGVETCIQDVQQLKASKRSETHYSSIACQHLKRLGCSSKNVSL